jgi:IclR family KDG regulon transcriptional repressor
LQALELVAETSIPLSLSSLMRRLKVPKSTLHGLLKAMVARRYLEMDRDGNYRLGVRSVEIAGAYLSRMTPLKVVHGELLALSRELNMTAHFAVLDGPDVLYLAKEDAPAIGLRRASAVGNRLPSHLTAVGKANLAQQSGKLDLDLQRAGSSGKLVGPEQLLKELEQVSNQGYAVDDGETLTAVRCVAAPVFDASGNCCGAIGVSYLRDGGPATDQIAARVMRAAAKASSQLGAHRLAG